MHKKYKSKPSKLNSRKLALDILFDALEKKIRTDNLLRNYRDHQHFNFINNLIDTTLKNLLTIDAIIEQHTQQDLTKKKFFLYLFRLVICEIYFLQTPQHAIFYEWVEIVKNNKIFSNLAPTVTAILHKLIKTFPNIEDIKLEAETQEDNITINYSIPKFIIEKLKKNFSIDQVEKFAKHMQTVPNTTIRLNTLKLPTIKIQKFLATDKLEIIKSQHFDDVAYIVHFPKAIKDLSTFREGMFYIQDEASIAFSRAMIPLIKDIKTICDVTAGPGGKLNSIYQYLYDKNKDIEFHAWDNNKDKTKLCQENNKRLNYKNIQAKTVDILKMTPSYKNKYTNYFDAILVDPPCSGWGSLRRKPQARYMHDEENLTKLQTQQFKIFQAASKLVKKGGYIFYSVCTMNPDESTEIIKKINEKLPQLKQVEFPKEFTTKHADFFKDPQTFSPEITKTNSDYLFAAVFQKL